MGSAPGNQQSSQATAVDSCFALIKIHQYNLAGSFYKTNLISHIYVLMTSNETRLIMQTIFILLSDRFLGNGKQVWIQAWKLTE